MNLSWLVVLHVPGHSIWPVHWGPSQACQHCQYPVSVFVKAGLDCDHCMAAKELQLLELGSLGLHHWSTTYQLSDSTQVKFSHLYNGNNI